MSRSGHHKQLLVQIISRTQWGAQLARKPFKALKPSRVRGVAIHHSGVKNGPKGLDAVKAFERYHLSKPGYIAIAYSYLVDEEGKVYEGRLEGSQSGATKGYNGVSEAICYTGDGDLPVPEAALKSIKELVDYIQKKYNSKLWVKPHRALGKTSCPGNVLAAWVVSGMPVEGATPLALEKSKEISRRAEAVARMPLSRRRRSRGEAVRVCQQRLNERGFDCGPADGIWGPKSAKACRAFQKSLPYLKADGICGSKTWKALFDA